MSTIEQPEQLDREQTPPAGLQIPESRGGFFGYSEEKSLQQVSVIYSWIVHIRGLLLD